MTQSPLHTAERSLLGDIMTSDTLWSSLLVLCDDCNGRFVGSDDEQRAAAFIRQSFEQYGLSNAHIEEFPLRGWRRGPANLTVNGHELACIGLPGTPPCDLSAPAIFLGDGEPADFEKAGEAPKGKIALVRGKGSHRLEKYARAVKAGCVGFVFSGAEPNALPPTGSLEFNGEPAPIPGVGIAYETLCRLERTAARGDMTAHLRVQAELFDAIGHNVIADLTPPGVESPDWLMMCAHYDGHDIAQGAVDNASGTAAVLEAAKALKVAYDRLAAQGAAPALGIRFALWSGEEVGMLGSSHYAAKHAGELSRIRLVFNCDIVGNPGTLFLGINGHDTDRLVAYFKGLADNQLFDIQAGNSIVIPYSDHFSFYLKGVPALMAATGGGKSPGPHTHGDTLDKVDVRAVRSATVFAARALLRLACDPAPLPARHATTEEVQDVLRKAGYEDLLKAQSRWNL
ncbi:MAG: M28 family peptidase [Anaerolineae bacterium]